MEKLPCTECGALILPTTAESTGGICMACKQGIRQNMERSRAYYQSLKEYDPVRELWHSLVHRSSKNPSLSDFSQEERKYFCVCLLEGEVYNGGFDQYFYNTSGNYYKEAVLGLIDLCAENSLSIVQRAAHVIFGASGPPEDRTQRWKTAKRQERFISWQPWRPKLSTLLSELDKEFWADPDHLSDLLDDYAESRGLVAPFKK